MMATTPLNPGTVISAGATGVPLEPQKAQAVAILNGIIALCAGIPQALPDLSTTTKQLIALIGLVVSLVGSPIVAYLVANKAKQDLQVMPVTPPPVVP
jgi:uncharacterized membrane protein HdeD (DUF308 family)